MIVPQLDLGSEYQQLRVEIDGAVQRVLASGNFIGGAENDALERELADYIGVAEVVCVNSGTDALLLSLKALGIGAGDEVIVPGFTFFATAEAVCLAGAQPRFADCSAQHYNIDVDSVRRALTPRTKAVIAVHLFGEPVDLAPLQQFCGNHGSVADRGRGASNRRTVSRSQRRIIRRHRRLQLLSYEKSWRIRRRWRNYLQ